MALHGNFEHHQLFGAKPHSVFPFRRVGEHLSLNLNPSNCFSVLPKTNGTAMIRC